MSFLSIIEKDTFEIDEQLSSLKLHQLIILNRYFYQYLTVDDYKFKKELIRIYGKKNINQIIKQIILYKLGIIEGLIMLINLTLLWIQQPEINIIITDVLLILSINHFLTQELLKRSDKIIEEINRTIPEFIDEITIYIESGYTINNAIEKSINEGIFMQINNYKNIENSYLAAIEKFANRYNVKTFNKLMIIINQSFSNGNKQLVSNLKTISMEAWSNLDKELNKKVSKIEAKLFIPIIIMFIGVLLIIIAPAFLNMLSLV